MRWIISAAISPLGYIVNRIFDVGELIFDSGLCLLVLFIALNFQ